MNVTTLSSNYPADCRQAIPGPGETVRVESDLAAESRRREKGIFPGIVLSLLIHAGVLASVLFAVANPFLILPTAGDDGIVRVSLVTVTPGPENGSRAKGPDTVKKQPVAVTKAALPDAAQKAPEKTVLPEAITPRPAEQAAQTSVSVLSVKDGNAAVSPGRSSPSGGAVRGQTQQGAAAKEGYSEAMPRYRENRPPAYPRTARERGYEGDVLIAAQVRADGQIGAVQVKRSSGYASLDESALDAVKRWRFDPARRMGSPVDVWVEIPLRFKLSPHDSFM